MVECFPLVPEWTEASSISESLADVTDDDTSELEKNDPDDETVDNSTNLETDDTAVNILLILVLMSCFEGASSCLEVMADSLDKRIVFLGRSSPCRMGGMAG